MEAAIFNNIETKVYGAWNRMAGMPMCENLYKDMMKNGWTKQAETFRNIVWATTFLHPEWSDREIIANFAKETGIC